MAARRHAILMVTLLTLGCGGSRQTTLIEEAPAPQKTGDASAKIAEGDEAWKGREDKAKVQAAIKAWEEAATIDPTIADIQLKLAYAYYFLADAQLKWDGDEDGMKAAYDKGVIAGEKAIKLLSPELAKQIKDGKEWEAAIPSVTKEGMPALYWYATNLGRWATLEGFTTLLSHKDRVAAIMSHCLKLDETYFHGAPHRYFGVYYTKIPFPGGDLPTSRKHFERSLEIAPAYQITKVLFAAEYAVKAGDKDLYKSLLEQVIATPDEVIPDLVPETKNAKRTAKQMLDAIGDKF